MEKQWKDFENKLAIQLKYPNKFYRNFWEKMLGKLMENVRKGGLIFLKFSQDFS